MSRLKIVREMLKTLKEFEYDLGCSISYCSSQEEAEKVKALWRGYCKAVGVVEPLLKLEEERNGNN